MFGVGLLVMVVALRRFAEEFCKRCDQRNAGRPGDGSEVVLNLLSVTASLDPALSRSIAAKD